MLDVGCWMFDVFYFKQKSPLQRAGFELYSASGSGLGGRFLGRFGGFGLGTRFRFLRFRRRRRVIHPLEDRLLRRIALALFHFDDARVTAVAFLERGRDVLKQNPQHVLFLPPFLAFVLGELFRGTAGVQARGRQPARLQGGPLAEGDDFFRDGTRGLGLGERVATNGNGRVSGVRSASSWMS